MTELIEIFRKHCLSSRDEVRFGDAEKGGKMTGKKTTRLCQHSGVYGPWYHRSTYEQTTKGTWLFVSADNSHLSHVRAKRVAQAEGLAFGRPCGLKHYVFG